MPEKLKFFYGGGQTGLNLIEICAELKEAFLNGQAKKVLVGMSGGVDSSVTAALLKQQGYEVTGITLKLYEEASRCCNLEDIKDAKAVAHALQIPHFTIDLREIFKEKIMDYFAQTYLAGKTPNPCPLCNVEIKFAFLSHRAAQLGIPFIATGHYARIRETENGFRLCRAKDEKKSQEYFLALLPEGVLKQTLFPLADYTKAEVRQLAQKFGFTVSEKKDSQEVCFIPDNHYVSFLESFAGITPKPGDLLNSEGKKVGTHQGFYRYTVGQRRGIGVGLGEPHYVTALCAEKNQVVVGTKEKVYHPEITVKMTQELDSLQEGQRVFVRIRYKNEGCFARVHVLDQGRVRLAGEEPFFAPAAGQLVVFYDPQGFVSAAGELES